MTEQILASQTFLSHPPPCLSMVTPAPHELLVMLAETNVYNSVFWIQASVFSSKLKPDGNRRQQNGI